MYIVESAPTGLPDRLVNSSTIPLPPRLLAAIAADRASFADFDVLPEPEPGERTHGRVHLGATHDVWLIRWGPGSAPPTCTPW